jgi:hypothetical protein
MTDAELEGRETRDVHIQASHGGVAAGVVHGSVSTANPPVPGPA